MPYQQTTFFLSMLIVLIVILFMPSSCSEFVNHTISAVEQKFLLQRLDYFGPRDNRLWRQRYFVNEEFYQRNKSRISILSIGGEGTAKETSVQRGLAYEAAKKYGGIIFLVEHRFYGKSQPFDNLSTDNLRYLNSLQALEDLATFVVEMNDLYAFGTDMKWITVGGSYAGSLSAWMRLKYPHLVNGAVSSSAPLHAKLNFPEYLQTVSNDIALQGTECVRNVKSAFDQLDLMFEGKQNGNLTAIFNLCSELKVPIAIEMDRLNLLEYLVDYNFAGTAQRHNYNKTLKEVCNLMNDKSIGNEVERLGNVTLYVNGEDCFEAQWHKYSEDLKNETITESGMMRQWWYQTCTEFAWYQVTTDSNPAFGNRIPLSYFLNLCKELYGDDVNQTFIEAQVKRTNNHFGGTDIDDSRIVFLHGSLDPWHPVGLYEKKSNRSYTVILIQDVAHCADLSISSENDPVQLKEAREKVLVLIGEWSNQLNSTIRTSFSRVILLLCIYFSVNVR